MDLTKLNKKIRLCKGSSSWWKLPLKKGVCIFLLKDSSICKKIFLHFNPDKEMRLHTNHPVDPAEKVEVNLMRFLLMVPRHQTEHLEMYGFKHTLSVLIRTGVVGAEDLWL